MELENPGHGSAPPPPPPPRGYPPQVVHVVSKPTSFGRVLGILTGLFFFGFVFIIGLVLGIVIILAGQSYEDMIVANTYRAGNTNQIAIIPVNGLITPQKSQFVRECVNHVLNNDSYQAVVLRVDSPGGAVTPSDEIWYQIKRLKDANLPVVASYGSLAASGGYYISCHCDTIVGQETCVTGSIGVIAQIFTMEELANKVGIEPVTLVASGSPDKDVANNVFRSWKEQDKEKVRQMLDSAYSVFRKRVKNGRPGAFDDDTSLAKVTDGSTFTAEKAVENGLIDRIGYLDDAITEAEKLAKIRTGKSTVNVLRWPPSFLPRTRSLQTIADGESPTPGNWLDADRLRNVVTELSHPRVMYLMQ